MSRASFKTIARSDFSSKPAPATVTIDRESGTVEVRPYRSREKFSVELRDVAEFVLQKHRHAELQRERAEKFRGKR